MSESILVIWSEELLKYDLGAAHPMAPGRLALTMALAGGLDVLARRNVRLAAPRPASDDLLQLVHDPAYIAAVRAAPLRQAPPCPPSSDWAAKITRSSMGCTKRRLSSPVARWTPHGRSGRARRNTRSTSRVVCTTRCPARASGFCIYNDVAVATAWLLADGVSRVAYVDVDAHHGDGVEAVFYADPRVLTISLHQSGYSAFPGTGFPDETGHGAAKGTTVNVALPSRPGTPAGCARSLPSCRRLCVLSNRRSS